MQIILWGLNPILTNCFEIRLRKHQLYLLRVNTMSEVLNRIHARHIQAVVLNVAALNSSVENIIGLIRNDLKSDIPIILMSETDDQINLIEEGIAAGANDFLMFPFQPIELVMRLRLQLYGSKALNIDS